MDKRAAKLHKKKLKRVGKKPHGCPSPAKQRAMMGNAALAMGDFQTVLGLWAPILGKFK